MKLKKIYKPFINNSNWKGINYPSNIKDWKRFEMNNPTFALNIVYIKGKEICPAYILKINSHCEKLILINNSLNDSKFRKRRLALSCSKKLSVLLRRINSKNNDDFYCLNCLHTFSTKNKLKPHEKVCKNKCGIVELYFVEL